MPSENSITTTEPLRGARTNRPATARDPRPSFLSTTCTGFSLARSIGESTVTIIRRHWGERPGGPCFKVREYFAQCSGAHDALGGPGPNVHARLGVRGSRCAERAYIGPNR